MATIVMKNGLTKRTPKQRVEQAHTGNPDGWCITIKEVVEGDKSSRILDLGKIVKDAGRCNKDRLFSYLSESEYWPNTVAHSQEHPEGYASWRAYIAKYNTKKTP